MIRNFKSSRRCGRASTGFTLVEVLVAMLFIAIVLPAIMQGIATATNMASDARWRQDAAGLAQSQLAQIIASNSWQSGNSSGDLDQDGLQFHWQSTVAPWTQDTSGEGLQQIDLQISWLARGKTKSITLSTLAYARQAETSAT